MPEQQQQQPQQRSPQEANGWTKALPADTGAGAGVAMDVAVVPEHNNNAAMVALPTAVVS